MTRKTTTKKPSQLDRIDKRCRTIDVQTTKHLVELRTKLGAMDAFVSTTLPAMFNEFRTMESKLDLLLKGSEIGEKEEPWVPKVGSLAVVNCDDYPTLCPRGTIGILRKPEGYARDLFAMYFNGDKWNFRIREVREPLPAEVQKYEEQVKAQEQEAKKAKLKFGTRVEYEDDRGWKVAMDKPTPDGLYVIVKEGHARMAWAKDSQLNLIDP